MPLLAIDTSSRSLSVGVRSHDHFWTRTRVCVVDSHFESLDHEVQLVLFAAGLKMKDITGIIVGSGPGSFTGLRIGFSWVQGTALALQVPVLQVSSFQAAATDLVARGISGQKIMITSDAGKGRSYCAEYALARGKAEQVSTPILIDKTGIQGTVFEIDSSSISGSYRIPAVVSGLLLSEAAFSPYSASAIACLEPQYVAPVLAKTIQERLKTA